MSKIDFSVNWKEGFDYFKKMYKDPSDTRRILALAKALNGPALKRSYDKLLTTKEGGEIAFHLPEFTDLHEKLPNCPIGSVGLVLFNNQQYSLDMLIRVSRIGKSRNTWINSKHPYIWMSRRYRDTHDLFHTLTGYQMDLFGEVCLGAFTYAQTGAYQWGSIFFMGICKFITEPLKVAAIFEAYYRGKRCTWLLQEDYEKMIYENLDECRVRIRLPRARMYDKANTHR